MQTAKPGAAGVRRSNDAEVPIKTFYEQPDEHPALQHWGAERARAEPPFRPRFMVYVGIGMADQTAERLGFLQDLGAEAFLLAWDLPSQLGLDPTNDLARAQVGRAGMSCATLDDMIDVCGKLDFARVDSIGTLANSVSHVGLGMAVATLEHYDAREVKIMVQNDPLKEFTARGTEIYDVAHSMRIACDCVAYAIDVDLPGWPMSVCSNHYDVAGAGPVVALAISLANAIAYVDELIARGYAVADIHKKLMFFFNERSDLFVAAAIFRMGRLLWSEILFERYGLPIEQQVPATIMGYAHGLESPDEPLANVARIAISAAGSMFGGVDYLCAAAYDEALRTPSADAAALALRTLQTVGMEHGVTATVDGLAGSRKLHEIDDYIYTAAKEELEQILARGGGAACVENGYIASRIDERRGVRERQIEDGERAFVGFNVFRSEVGLDVFSGHSSGPTNFELVESAAQERIRRNRERRDDALVEKTLVAVLEAAAGAVNLVPPAIAALRARATLEEIVQATTHGFASSGAR